MSDLKQDEIDRLAQAALKGTNFKLEIEIYFEAEGIRPAELPENIEEILIPYLVRRLPPFIPASVLKMPGCWRLIMRVASGASYGKTDA